MNTLEYKVLNWANEKGILNNSNPTKQTLKFISEAGELADAIAKTNGTRASVDVVDAIGDSLVCLIILSAMLNTDIEECLSHAYDEISGRTGEMVNGIFIKDEVKK